MNIIIKSLLLTTLLSGMVMAAASQAFSSSENIQNEVILSQASTETTIKVSTPSVRNLGAQTAGDYRFQLIASPARGWYEPKQGKLVWISPARKENQYLELILTSTIDQKPLPNAGIKVSIYDKNNKLRESKRMIMMWSVTDYHYGNNFTIPADGNYTVKVEITPPMFARLHKNVGKKFFSSAKVTFRNVALKNEGQFKE